MKTKTLLSLVLLILSTMFLASSAQAQQEKLPTDPVARQQVMQALQTLRSQIPQLPALAQTRHAAKFSDDDSTDTGGITGRIEGFSADADSAGAAWVLAVAAHLHEDPTAWAFGQVNADGDYTITGLNTGTYLVMAGADGFLPQFFSHAYHIWEAIPVEVAPHEITQGIDFFLEPLETGEGSMAGVVISEETGDPISGAQIYAFNAANPFIAAWTQSNDDGSFNLENLRSGPYYVQAFAQGYFAQYYDGVERIEDATTVQIADGEVTSDITFQMDRGGTISGTAVDAAGDPILGASIQAYIPASRGIDTEYHYGWAATDESGNYVISGLGSGDYVVSLHYHTYYYSVSEWYDNATSESDATPVPVILGEDTAGINFEVNTPTDFGSISGKIEREDGSAVQTAIVRLESTESSNFYFYNFAQPDENGFYKMDNVPIGEYRVVLEYWSEWFYDVMWYDQANNPEDATPVTIVDDEQTQNIDFVIPVAEGVLTGTVTNIEGKPVANAHIQLNNTFRGDHTGAGGYIWAYATTDRNGEYRIEGLPDGEFLVSAFLCYFESCSQQWWPGVEFEDRAELVVIADGQSNPPSVDFEIPIEFGNASISGIVNHVDGSPLEGALVSLAPTSNYPDSSDVVGDAPWVSELQAYTDSEGRYAFDYLPEGTFYLYSSYWEEGASGFAWYENASDITDATPITLGPDESLEDINFALDVRSYIGTVAGTVTLEDGTPLSRAYVEVNSYYRDYTLDIAYYPYEWYGITDANGNYAIDHLYEGEYQISVYAQGAIHASMDSSGVEVTHIKVSGGETTVVDLSMTAQQDGPAEIGGTITSEQGETPEISFVKAVPVVDNGAAFYTAIADENGVYRFSGLPEGEYFLQARAPMYLSEYYEETYDPAEASLVSTLENLPAESIDFSLEPFYYLFDYAEGDALGSRDGIAEQASIIYGTVENEAGEAVSGATIYVVDETGDPILSTETFEDGMYELAGVQPGASYRVKASQIGYESQFNGDNENLNSAPELTMSNGRYELNFTLKKSGTLVSTGEEPNLPKSLELLGNYPNPFRAATRFQFALPKSMHVSIAIYDTLGRRIAEVHDGVLPSGSHDIRWDVSTSSSDLSSGLYFYRITTDNESQAGSMTILR